MVNGRAWDQDELAHIDLMLEPDGYLQKLAHRLDRTPEAILLRAQKVLKSHSPDETPRHCGSDLGAFSAPRPGLPSRRSPNVRDGSMAELSAATIAPFRDAETSAGTLAAPGP